MNRAFVIWNEVEKLKLASSRPIASKCLSWIMSVVSQWALPSAAAV